MLIISYRFLLAQLHMDSFTDLFSPLEVEEALGRLPKGSDALDTAYGQALQRISDQRPGAQALAWQVLGWITYAERLLTVDELLHAIAVTIGASDIDRRRLKHVDDVLSVCAGLVIVDKQNTTIRLVHYTTQNYFKSTGNNILPETQKNIAATCLTCLQYDVFGAGYEYRSVKDIIPQYPFFGYAAKFWASHVGFCNLQELQVLLRSFLGNDYKVSYAAQALLIPHKKSDYYPIDVWKTEPYPAMHLASYLGTGQIISMLLENGHDVNVRDGRGATPLWMAVEFNVIDVVKLLLSKKDVDVNHVPIENLSALQLASSSGHLEIVTSLLAHKQIDVNFRDRMGRTALALAAMKDHDNVIQLLLNHKHLDVNLVDFEGRRALSWDVRLLCASSVKALLADTNIDPNFRDWNGMTPLLGVASWLYDDIIRSNWMDLRSLDLNIKRKTNEWRTDIVEVLLSRADVDVNARTLNGRSALWFAAFNGMCGIFKLLLTHPKVELGNRDAAEWTFLAQTTKHTNTWES